MKEILLDPADPGSGPVSDPWEAVDATDTESQEHPASDSSAVYAGTEASEAAFF